MKVRKQTSVHSDTALLRAAINEHVARLSEVLARHRKTLQRLEARATEPIAANGALQRCLDETRGELDLIYDTMVRMRWAAFCTAPSPPLADDSVREPRGEEGETMPETGTTIYVVDDDASVRKALSRLFRSVGYQVQDFASAPQFLQAGASAFPACVVLDVRMPRMSGIDLQHELAQAASDLPIVFITGHGDIDMAVQAMKDGAVDFLPKPFDDQDLLDAVQRAVEYHRDAHESGVRRQEAQARLARLTPREREVFERVVKGMLNKQIASELGTAEKTVKVHRARVMEKMEAESLADLVRLASRVGIEGPDADEAQSHS